MDYVIVKEEPDVNNVETAVKLFIACLTLKTTIRDQLAAKPKKDEKKKKKGFFGGKIINK